MTLDNPYEKHFNQAWGRIYLGDPVHAKQILNNLQMKQVVTRIIDCNNQSTSAALKKQPKMRTYCTFKTQIMLENYLLNVKNLKTRIAASQFRLSDHRLEIETGRYHRPKKNVNDRLCSVCNEVENEMHCLMACKINKEDREKFFNAAIQRKTSFKFMDDKQRFVFLM